MAIIHLTEASIGAPRLSGTNGDLNAVLRWALVQNGWAIEFTNGTTADVFRPGTGNRFRLCVQHDSAVSGNAGLATVRGAENASNATTYIDPFPTVALVGNTLANWAVSSAANTTSRAFDIWVAPTYVIYAVNFAGATNQWEIHFFGDIPPAQAGDPYNTTVFVRQVAGAPGTSIFITTAQAASLTGSNLWWWARTFDGTIKSTTGGPSNIYSSAWGAITSAGAALTAPTTGITTQKVSMKDTGSTSTTPTVGEALVVRGWLPQIINPLHQGKGTTNTRDTYVDTAYNALFSGTIFASGNVTTSPFLVIEGDTWTPPPI